jgi:hypothetical protein
MGVICLRRRGESWRRKKVKVREGRKGVGISIICISIYEGDRSE